jgi:uncharacterized protein
VEPQSSTWTVVLREIAAKASTDDGAHDLCHLYRVWRTAQILLQTTPEADALVVQAACFLHDLVSLPKNHPERRHASREAARQARRQLEAVHLPGEKLDAVAHAIEAHSYSALITPTSIEAKLVQDADRLDALGAIGCLACFTPQGAWARHWRIRPTPSQPTACWTTRLLHSTTLQ